MRKVLVIGLAAVALFALTASDVSSCGGDKSSTKSGCAASKSKAQSVTSEETQQTGAKSGCLYSKGATANAQLTAEEHAKLCDYKGKCELRTISVKGMTCTDCEQSVSAALAEVPGLIKVLNVSYKDGLAEVCIDPTKTTGEALTTAVVNKGFKAEIVSAVAKSSDVKGSHKGCGAKAACCAAHKAKAETKSDAEGSL